MGARAIVFAAGRGERMRPLTDDRPKAMLPVGGRPLIEWQVTRLAQAGVREIVVNVSAFGELIEAHLGDGSRFGATIAYSREDSPLETAGAVAKARGLLGDGAFLAVSADIHTTYDYRLLAEAAARVGRDPLANAAHFVLVPNPPWHAKGDMGLAEGRVTLEGPALTYANLSVFHASLFDGLDPGARLALFPWAYRFVEAGRVTGERFDGPWDNVGTPAQLAALDARLSG